MSATGLGWTARRQIGSIVIVIDETPTVQDLLEAWRDTARAAELAYDAGRHARKSDARE
ncbi:MAG TPA: hypothetical protein VD763_01750 [Candidatus Saccharimonadales bacterium]|nr:hypothetical protein [Candidatus Saccharimonadales bacterium]